jgi:muramoyltetrapeptide carboxypeptidase
VPRTRVLLPVLAILAATAGGLRAADPAGTADDPVIDSKMTAAEAFDGLDPNCPREIRERQAVVSVLYWGFDDKVHRGQLVIDKDLEKDITEVFAVALKHKFPVRSVIPISHPRFRKDRVWSDDLSMAANNTSGFNYRLVTGGKTLSNHARGRALDLNPLLNPYVKGDKVLPPGAKYDPKVPGTLTADHPVTRAFLDRGWAWGGTWRSIKDYQHFEKVADGPADWVRPPALKPGDTIAFVAPAGPAELPKLRAYAAELEKAGYRVAIPDGIGERRSGYLGGTDEERAAELNAAIRNPKVRAVFPVRGGFGLTRILDRIDYAALRKDPKIVTGYSDLTALHLAIARQARVVTFHSPLVMHNLWQVGKPEHAFAADSFRRAVFADRYTKGQAGYTIPAPADAKPVKLVGGTARGRLLGGNLSLICATLGTPYAIQPKGAILFVEDVNEAPYRVDRMLSQLRLAGALDEVAGVVVGSFTTKEPAEAKEVDRVLREYFGALKVPVLMQFPVGHAPPNATLPHGGLVELDADGGTLRVVEDPVRLE